MRVQGTRSRTRGRPPGDLTFSQYVEKVMTRAVYEPDPAGGWVVCVPLLPGCASQGDTVEQARTMIRDAIEGWITLALQMGDPIPAIGGVRLGPMAKAKTRRRA